jgi:glycosyltransferase involved in cell wall biosynthesis
MYWASQGRQYARAVDRLLPDSESLKTVYAESGFNMARSTVIPELIDYERLRTFGGNHPRPARSYAEPWHIGYVGRLIRAKGVDLLLEAVDRLVSRVNIHVHIAGDGPERATLEQQARRLGLSDRVTFHGWMPQEQVWILYDRADLFVHPGRWPEPFGRTIIEAMTLGLPTIVSDVGHPPTLVRDVGLTFRSGDSADLARSILAAIDDYDRLTAASHEAGQRAAQFSREVVVDALQNVYRGLIHARSPAAP